MSTLHNAPTTVVAFHGSPGTPSMFCADMGDFARQVDEFPKWQGVTQAFDHLLRKHQVILIGFSKGGERATQLANLLPNVVGVVLYESPLPRVTMSCDPEQPVTATCPALLLWNRNGRQNWDRCYELSKAWANRAEGDTTTLYGQGRHTRWEWKWPPLRHNWDQQLNFKIGVFLEYCKDTVKLQTTAPNSNVSRPRTMYG